MKRFAISTCALLAIMALSPSVGQKTNYLGTIFVADPTVPTRQMTVNADGSINANTTGSGAITAQGPTAAGSAASTPPVITGGTVDGTATGAVKNATVKAASTAAAATDTALVVTNRDTQTAVAPSAAGATQATVVGGQYNSGGVTLTTGQQSSAQLTSDGRLMVGLSSAGAVAPGTAGTKSNLSGGIYTAAGVSLTDGQQVAEQVDINGRKLIVSGASKHLVSSTLTKIAGTGTYTGATSTAPQAIASTTIGAGRKRGAH